MRELIGVALAPYRVVKPWMGWKFVINISVAVIVDDIIRIRRTECV